MFQLPRLDQNEIDLESGSKHKAMIENALHSAIECLIFSNELNDDVLTGCPIEITKVTFHVIYFIFISLPYNQTAR